MEKGSLGLNVEGLRHLGLSVDDKLWILPLGGMGEVGNNSCVIVDPKTGVAIVVDAGTAVERTDLFGGQFGRTIADDTPLQRLLALGIIKKIKYLVITHFHRDHLEAATVFSKKFNVSVAMSEATYDILYERCKAEATREMEKSSWGRRPPQGTAEQKVWDDELDKEIDKLLPSNLRKKKFDRDKSLIHLGQGFCAGNLKVTALNVPHSARDTIALLIEGNGGRSAFFPDHRRHGYDQEETDAYANVIQRIRQRGALNLMMVDALNSQTPGRSQNEENVVSNIVREILRELDSGQKRVFVTFQAGLERRFEGIYKALREEAAKRNEPGLVPTFLGYAMAKTAERYGFPSTRPDGSSRIIFLTGCQFEGNEGCESILYKMFLATKKLDADLTPFKPGEGDSVLICARLIPDNFSAMKAGIIKMLWNEAKVVLYSGEIARLQLEGEKNVREADIHMSGHAPEEDHREEFADLEPGVVIPTHASWEESAAMARLLPPCSKLVLVRNGEVYRLTC